ncbi:hypothetical protein [Ralstonia solanacearum]|nr:hypothetical protein [Ralstonia solanacearum]
MAFYDNEKAVKKLTSLPSIKLRESLAKNRQAPAFISAKHVVTRT